MAYSLKTFAGRRWRNLALLCAACIVLVTVERLFAVSLRSSSWPSGLLLLAAMIILASYNVYKKLPFLLLLRSSTWLQLHIYVGLFTILLFPIHAGFHVPHGLLGKIMAGLYLGVAGSGLAGLAMSRAFPRLLSMRGPEIIFEQIPARRLELRQQVEKLLLDTAAELQSTQLADLYSQRLAKLFNGQRHFWLHFFQYQGRYHALLTEMKAQERYLNAREREIFERVTGFVKAKDDLDIQGALQCALKYWLFIHIPLTYALMIFTAVHVALVYACSGGLW